jgi:alpha-beta hydrolase superfamily lysophospholipase
MLSHPSRFTEQGTFAVADDADMDEVARTISGALCDRAAECAYAVEEVVEALAEQRPRLAGMPRVALGMSGGAMVLPTVVARNADAYCGAVLIAGGADYLHIAMDSNYASWIDALRFRRPGGAILSDGCSSKLCSAYRRCAALDSYYTAAALRGKPTLMLHGTADRAVPAALGDLLWERAGRPERWSFDVGHELLFLGLPMQLDRIGRWLDEHARPIGRTATPSPDEWFGRPPAASPKGES